VTPGARVAAAIEIMDLLDETQEATNVVINSYFRKRRYAGSKDRREVTSRTYDVLRHLARLDWSIEKAGLQVSSRLRLIASVWLDENIEIEVIFTGQGHSPAELNETEQTFVAQGISVDTSELPFDVALEIPSWIAPDLIESLGDSTESEFKALNQTAPVDLRTNTLKTNLNALKEALKAEGLVTTFTQYSPMGLRIDTPTGLQNTEAFKNGDFEIQDEGSQLASLLCDVQPGMAVADVCAGAGGKSLAFAAIMKGQGLIDACDISSERLSRMGARLTRSGAEIVRSHVVGKDGEDWFAQHQSGYDRVLVDAPCSGTGTWRRDPASKWRLTPESLKTYKLQQAKILSQAAVLVKSGGRLIFVTCSLLMQEGEEQVGYFLENIPGFKVMDTEKIWSKISILPFPGPGPFLRLSPAKTKTDGFFIAVLEFNA
jgi:16S rRNA (cytosine967-C5)-methyltransferase